eukprot:TRINITY_DN11571_c0_g1_i1.p1 TRINITY_DN11571_c0_g1~~TRINITY_DN11571_c0_g1_i1.p1  ORF type:complete len:163 (-),score=12.03 TRINITY_DN11571_c0_g1_i1:206-694(-)
MGQQILLSRRCCCCAASSGCVMVFVLLQLLLYCCAAVLGSAYLNFAYNSAPVVYEAEAAGTVLVAATTHTSDEDGGAAKAPATAANRGLFAIRESPPPRPSSSIRVQCVMKPIHRRWSQNVAQGPRRNRRNLSTLAAATGPASGLKVLCKGFQYTIAALAQT